MTINIQFAVTFENESKHYKGIPDEVRSPKDLIDMLKKHFGKEQMPTDDFSLIGHIKDEPPVYLKELNYQSLPRIYMIDLCPQVEKEVIDIKNQLASKDQDIIKKALDCLVKRLLVQEFVRYCIEHSLHIDLFKLVERVMQIRNGNEDLSILTMKVFAELIAYTNSKEEFEESEDRPLISWLNIKPETIRSALEYCKTSQNFNGIDSSLKVLVRYVNQNEALRDYIFKNLDSSFIFGLLEKLHKSTTILRPLKCSIQISLISLINCSLANSRDSKEKFNEKFQEYFGRDRMRALKDNVDIICRKLREFPSALPPSGCSEPTKEEHYLISELTKLQYFILLPIYWGFNDNLYDGPKIQELELFKQIFSGSEADTEIQIFEKLGFQNPSLPAQDFIEPPGHLVFHCVKHLIHHCYEEKINVFFKRGINFPLVKIAFSLVKILDRAIQLTEVVDENMDGGIYLPLIFHASEINNELSKGFFYELFYRCFMVYAQSLIDLKLKPEDLEEHEEYFLNQINEVMNCYPTTFHDFSVWLSKVRTENTRKKKLEAQIMEWESNQHIQNPVISQLRSQLETEYKALVSEKRIRQLQERPYSFDLQLVKSLRRFSLQLDDSQSIIFVKEESDPNSKIDRWPVSSIKKILRDNSCSHYNSRKDNTFYFSLTLDPRDDTRDDTPTQFKIYNFTCNHKKNYSIWIDGIHILRNEPPPSQEYKEDVLNLVRMEMKIRFLLLSKENIHNEAPTLPTLPNNYDFLD